MQKLTVSAALVLALVQAAAAADLPASEKSVNELLAVSGAHAILDKTVAQVDALMHQAMEQATAGQPLNPEQKQIMEETQSGMMGLMKEQLGWDVLQPMMLEIYRKSLTQEDVDGMLKFYRSRAGQALIAKMPAIMQNTMAAMQEQMKTMMPKVRQLIHESTEKIQAAATKPAGSTNP